jgi:glycosyltransferase involved in cell wall biosynthesis
MPTMLNTEQLRQVVRRHPWLRALLALPVLAARWLYALSRLPREAAVFYMLWRDSGEPGIGKNTVGRMIVMIVVSDLRIDPRVEREARALAGAGYDVTVIWPDMRDPQKHEPEIDWGPGVSFRNLPRQLGAFAYRFPGFLGYEMAKAALEHRPFAFHAHDLTTALIGMIAAGHTGAHLVCDFHEWYSENVTWSGSKGAWVPHPWYVRRAHRWLERRAFENASAIITVCDSLAREMKAELGRPDSEVSVIRNIPDLSTEPTRNYRPLKEELGLGPDVFLLLYQGGVGPSRMIEPIIEALPLVGNCVFVIRGPGVEMYGDGYRRRAERRGVSDRLILLPPIPSRDVVAAAVGADAGIWTLPNLCKNFYYALPNKIFEYLAAGLPILSAHFPEPKAIIERYQIGLCFNPRDPHSIADTIRTLASDRSLVSQMARRTQSALQALEADTEWEKLVAVYRGLEASSGEPLHFSPMHPSAEVHF